MTALPALIKRNSVLFFKDKGMFFSSLITPLILLVLYATFLAEVYRSSFGAAIDGAPEKLINAIVGGQLLSSLLAVSCVTVAFCSNLLMVQDKANDARRDLTITPVKRWTLALGYYISTAIVTLIVCLIALCLCLVYIAMTGWYMTVGDILLLIGDVFLLVMFGTALSSIVNFFLTTQGQMSAVGTIISSVYGFICGAYMPLSQFNEGLRNVLMFLPGTYGTSLIRNHALAGALREMEANHWPQEAIEEIKNVVDGNVYFFGDKVEIWVMYLVLICTVVLCIGIYVLLNILAGRKKQNTKKGNIANEKN